MNKTIFQIDYKISVLIISILGIIVGLISNVYGVNGIVAFLLYFIKINVLTLIYLSLYLIENKCEPFKHKLKYIFGYLLILNASNLIFSILTSAHVLPQLFFALSGIVSLYVIISFVAEILDLYYKNEIVAKLISFNKKIGNAIANPIVNFIEKITND